MSRQYCPRGHDIHVVGRAVNGMCRECKRALDRADYAASPEYRARKARERDARRGRPGARLDESMRDTMRYTRNRLSHNINRAEELYP